MLLIAQNAAISAAARLAGVSQPDSIVLLLTYERGKAIRLRAQDDVIEKTGTDPGQQLPTPELRVTGLKARRGVWPFQPILLQNRAQ